MFRTVPSQENIGAKEIKRYDRYKERQIKIMGERKRKARKKESDEGLTHKLNDSS
jgi:hypothetical protein